MLYSNKGYNKYRKNPNLPQNNLEDSKILNLGVVGEQVGSKSTRRAPKIGSVDMKLPKIGDGISQERDSQLRNQNSIDNIKLPKLSKNSGNYRYKYRSKANKEIYDSYIGKNVMKPNNSNKVLNKLKMYQNNIKISPRDFEKRKPYHKRSVSKYSYFQLLVTES